MRRSCSGERGVDREVAVDGRDALPPHRRVGGAAAHLPFEGQRPRLGADDGEARGLGDQAGVEAVVELQRGEGSLAAVLLRGHRLEHDLGLHAPAQRRHGVQRGDHAGPSCRRRRARGATRRPARRRTGRAPAVGARGDRVEMAVEAEPPWPGPRAAWRWRPPARSAAPPRRGGRDAPAARARSCSWTSTSSPSAPASSAKRSDRRPLVAGRAGHGDERARVPGEGVAVDRLQGGALAVDHGAAEASACRVAASSPRRRGPLAWQSSGSRAAG